MLFQWNHSHKRGRDPALPLNDSPMSSLDWLLRPSDFVNADEALHNSDLFSVVFQIASDLANSRFIADAPRTQSFLDHPCSLTNRQAFWQGTISQLLLAGNAYAYIWRNVNGQPIRFEFLRPSQVGVFRLADGSGLIYNLNFDEPTIGTLNNVPQTDMLHFRLFSNNGGLTGTSPLMALQDILHVKDRANQLTLTALNKAILPNGLLSVKDGSKLNRDEKISTSNDFAYQIAHGKGPAVLDNLTEYTPLEIKTDVSKLLASTDWTGTQIAKIFGIPDSYINGKGDQQSSLTMIQGMYANALNRYANALSAELNNKLNANIAINVQPAIDQDGSVYSGVIGTAVKNNTIPPEMGEYLLRRIGFIPADATHYAFPVKGGEPSADH